MIKITTGKFLTQIQGLPEDLIDLFVYQIKVEFDKSAIKNLSKYQVLPLLDIPEIDLGYSVSSYDPQANSLTILTGNLYQVIQTLRQLNLDYRLFKSSPKILSPEYQKYLDIRPEQQELVEVALKFKRCLVEAPTAFGKTRAVAQYLYQFHKIAKPKLVLVPTVDLMHQTRKSLADYLQVEIGVIGDSLYEPQASGITVAVVDSLFSRIKKQCKLTIELLNSIEVFIADEAHSYANFRGALICRELKSCSFYLGVSATFCIKNIQLLIGLIGPIAKKFTIANAIANKTILKPKIIFQKVPQLALPAGWENKEYSNWFYNQSYQHCIVNNTQRTKLIVATVEKLIAQNMMPFVILVKSVGTTKSKGNKIPHSQIIQSALEEANIHLPILHGKTKKRDTYIEQLKSSELMGCIASQKIMGTGIDITSLKAIVLAQAGSSDKEFIQNVGRALRGDAEEQPLIYDYYDQTHYFESQASKRLKLAQQEYPDVVLLP